MGAKRRSGLNNVRSLCLEWLDLHYNISDTAELINTSVYSSWGQAIANSFEIYVRLCACTLRGTMENRERFTAESLGGCKWTIWFIDGTLLAREERADLREKAAVAGQKMMEGL